MSQISPIRQAGSWQLQDWLVIVEKLGVSRVTGGLYEYLVEFEPPRGMSSLVSVDASSPCMAALLGVVKRFGQQSKEAREFHKHYPCDESDRGVSIGKSMKLDFNDEGGSLSGGYQLYEDEIHLWHGTRWACREEYEYGTEAWFDSERAAQNAIDSEEYDCVYGIEPIAATGWWFFNAPLARVHIRPHGPFDTKTEAEAFADRVFGPILKRGLKLDFNDDGGSLSGLPSWARRPGSRRRR